ncbi:MAG: hypothetical protein CMJ84_14570 [Planctomycetes bacterium]|nr:hypothetical protein [Planctomycetota bacterium]
MRASLQVPEEFDLAESVSITGQLYALNVKSETFSVDTSPKRVSVRYHGIDLRRIDTLRWKRVTVVGRPTDPRCRALDSIESVRLAKEDEEDGIMVPAEEEAVRDLEEYGRFARALSELESLGPNWDSYGAKAPRRPILEQADEFTLAAFGILLAHDVEPIAPFVVPTRAGSVQLEWSEDDRELELELGNSGQFQYLVVSHDHEAEGPCKRWHALRLVRWVLTGEDA